MLFLYQLNYRFGDFVVFTIIRCVTIVIVINSY